MSTTQSGPDQDKARPRDPAPVFLDARREFAERFLAGEGLEIGALHLPLETPRGPSVSYVDRMTVEDLRTEYAELDEWDLTPVDVIDNGELLSTIPEASQDFIVANHFLEHCEDPIRTIETHLGKLRPGGVLFYAVPDKRYTFDYPAAGRRRSTTWSPTTSRGRSARAPSTTTSGPAWSSTSEAPAGTEGAAFEEWAARRARALEEDAYSIHMHVWTQAEFLELILHCRERFDGAFDIEAAARQGDRVHRRPPQGRPPACPARLRPGPRRQAAACEQDRGEGPRGRLPQLVAANVSPTLRQPPMASDDAFPTTAAGSPPRPPERPPAIEVEGLKKTFRIPTQRVDSLKERATAPVRGPRVPRAAGARRRLLRRPPGRVLRHRRPQRLRQEHAAEAPRQHLPGRRRDDPDGRAGWRPFIELGVGFNPELTARENVVLNGVMMGLTRAARRAARSTRSSTSPSSSEFVDLKLKNYSSGMLVRLAFSVMIQVDADVLLIDEVLAVGDAAFQQKCADVFHEMQADGQDDRPRHPRHGDGRGRTATGRC